MPEGAPSPAAEIRRLLDLEHLREWVQDQRWYASKSRAITNLEVVESVVLSEDPILLLALVQTGFATGTHEIYQLPLELQTPDRHGNPAADAVAHTEELSFHEAFRDSHQAGELLRRMEAGDTIEAPNGAFSFHSVGEGVALGAPDTVRAMGVEQSNSSIVFDEQVVLKVIRKLEPGINPELEILRFLTEAGFPHIAPLRGWYEYNGQVLCATLGVAQEFLPGSTDGWELALAEIPADPERFLERLGSLGEITAEMHSALAGDASDPAFAPEEPSQEALALLTATVDEDIERIFVRLPDDERVAPIYGRGQDVRERLSARAQIGVGGRTIRTHGDYHLGQTLSTDRGWVIIDFEGEPARPLPERRQKRSPLRDVAGMLRSFSYVTAATRLLHHAPAPEDFERRAREIFLACYFERIDSTLLPAGEAATMNLLSVFELEKAIYELAYELDNRPDWVGIPVSGIARLLESA